MAVEVVNLSSYSVISIWTLHTAITSERIAVGLLACNVPRLLNCLLDTFFFTFPYMSLTGVCLVTYMPIPPKLSGYYKQFLFNRSALNDELHHSPRPWPQPRVTQGVASCETQWRHSVKTKLYNTPSPILHFVKRSDVTQLEQNYMRTLPHTSLY